MNRKRLLHTRILSCLSSISHRNPRRNIMMLRILPPRSENKDTKTGNTRSLDVQKSRKYRQHIATITGVSTPPCTHFSIKKYLGAGLVGIYLHTPVTPLEVRRKKACDCDFWGKWGTLHLGNEDRREPSLRSHLQPSGAIKRIVSRECKGSPVQNSRVSLGSGSYQSLEKRR